MGRVQIPWGQVVPCIDRKLIRVQRTRETPMEAKVDNGTQRALTDGSLDPCWSTIEIRSPSGMQETLFDSPSPV